MRTLPRSLVLSAAAFVAASVLLAEFRMARTLEGLRRVADESAPAPEEAAQRPVLRGEPVEGSAHGAYAPLFASEPHEQEEVDVSASTSLAAEWLGFLGAREESPESRSELAANWVAEHAWVLDALAEGARRTDPRPAIDWSGGAPLVPKLLHVQPVVETAHMAIAAHMDRGRSGPAVDVLLDLLQFGGDLTYTPGSVGRMIGAHVVDTAVGKVLFDDGLLDRLPPSELRRLEQGLARFETGLPAMRGAGSEDVALWSRSLLEAYPDGNFVRLGESTLAEYLAFAFLGEHRELDRFRGKREWSEREAELPDTWRAWIEEARRYRQDRCAKDDPSGVAQTVETAQRELRVDLRVARTAIAYRLSGEVLALHDPFAHRLVDLDVEFGRDRVRIHSYDSNGVRVHRRDFALN